MKDAAKKNIKISDAVLSGLFSVLLPGVGQFYQGRWLVGILFLVAVGMWDIFFMPIGWFIHVWCVLDALVYGLTKR